MTNNDLAAKLAERAEWMRNSLPGLVRTGFADELDAAVIALGGQSLTSQEPECEVSEQVWDL